MPKPSKALLNEGFFKFKSHASEGKCWVRGCSRESRADRCLCQVHTMRRWRCRNKQISDYCTLRDHAAGRHLKFTITVDYWKGLVDAFGFYDATRDKDVVLTIDRVDATKGYEEGNLRVVSVNVNSYKTRREQFLPEHVQSIIERKRAKLQSSNAKYLALGPQPIADEELPLEATEQNEFLQYSEEDCPF